MTDTPTPPPAGGSQEQERKALALDISRGDDTDPNEWDDCLVLADRLIAAGWTRRPSGAGEASEIERLQNVVAAYASAVDGMESYLLDRTISEPGSERGENTLGVLRGHKTRLDADAKAITNARWADYRRLTERAERAEAALALRGDAETDAPAAAEPQAGAELSEGDEVLIRGRFFAWKDAISQEWEPKPYSTEKVAQVQVEHPGVGWTLIHEVVASAIRPTPDTTAPASAMTAEGLPPQVVDVIRAAWEFCNDAEELADGDSKGDAAGLNAALTALEDFYPPDGLLRLIGLGMMPVTPFQCSET